MATPESKPGDAPSGISRGGRRPSLWAALVGYWTGGEREPLVAARSGALTALDDEDFSAEHGYEAGFEGRSEFEHGEFERWI